jgi:hypothetical protein
LHRRHGAVLCPSPGRHFVSYTHLMLFRSRWYISRIVRIGMRPPPTSGRGQVGDHVQEHHGDTVRFLGGPRHHDVNAVKVVPNERNQYKPDAAQVEQDGLEIRASCIKRHPTLSVVAESARSIWSRVIANRATSNAKVHT